MLQEKAKTEIRIIKRSMQVVQINQLHLHHYYVPPIALSCLFFLSFPINSQRPAIHLNNIYFKNFCKVFSACDRAFIAPSVLSATKRFTETIPCLTLFTPSSGFCKQ